MIIEDAKVIQFKPEKGFTYRKTSNHEQIICDHVNVIVDEETRTIECGKCAIILDPF